MTYLPVGILLSDCPNLFKLLFGFVHPDRDVSQNVVQDTEPAFDLTDDLTISLNCQQDVEPFGAPLDFVGQFLPAHLLGLDNTASAPGDDALDLRIQLVDLFLWNVRIHDEHDFVLTHMLASLCFSDLGLSEVHAVKLGHRQPDALRNRIFDGIGGEGLRP